MEFICLLILVSIPHSDYHQPLFTLLLKGQLFSANTNYQTNYAHATVVSLAFDVTQPNQSANVSKVSSELTTGLSKFSYPRTTIQVYLLVTSLLQWLSNIKIDPLLKYAMHVNMQSQFVAILFVTSYSLNECSSGNTLKTSFN